MKRSIFGLFAVLLIFGCAENASDQKVEKKRQYILFIMSDGHPYQAISVYNDALIQTPNG